MNYTDNTLLTTKQAAQLVHVHESSVKRWCKELQLPCDTTEGGHRRINLQDLLSFAEKRNISCLLGEFSSNADEIWRGFRDAKQKNDYDFLFDNAYRLLRQHAVDQFSSLVLFCMEQGIIFSTLFDAILARALRQVGSDWQTNELDVGTEHYITEIIRDVMHLVRIKQHDKKTTNGLTAIIGCSAGNQHDMGAQAIRIILESKGWKTIYLGASVPVTDFATLQARHNAELVCISFISANMISEAKRFIEVLARFYDDKLPYHLAIGGHMFPEDAAAQLTSASLRPFPFKDLNVYRSTEAFNHWLEKQLISDT